MKRYYLILALLSFQLISSSAVRAQLSSVTLTTDKCDYIESNVGYNLKGKTNTTFSVGTKVSRHGAYFQRAFIEFDLRSIPSNAIIYEATLDITRRGGPFVENDFITKLVTSSWTEGTLTSKNQPKISDFVSDWEKNYTSPGSVISIDVKNTLQRMVHGQVSNYGWSIQVVDEAAKYTSGTSFYSDESLISPPKLKIKYYLPIALSNVTITHETSDGSSDGGIRFFHSRLDLTHSYKWTNASGVIVGTSQHLTGVPYGWYGVEITGNTNQRKEYFAFIVGLECKEVSIEFAPDKNFIDNAFNNGLSTGVFDFGNWNSGNNAAFQTGKMQFASGFYSTNSLMQFRLWIPDDVFVNKADLTLSGIQHFGANAASLKKVTSYWHETTVTWNNQPTSTGAISANIPTMTSANDAVVDMRDLWNDWKQNNAGNYGVLFDLDSYALPTKRQLYHSPTTSDASKRPKIDFKILYWKDECNVQYAHLDYEMDGYYSVMKGGKIRFVFDQEYDADDLEFNIYNYKDELVRTEADFAPIATSNGDNYLTIDVTNSDCIGRGFFYLEVINSKKEKLYLRFFNDYTGSQCGDTSIDPGGDQAD